MPSAASVKIEKQIAEQNALMDPANQTPIRQAITVIEHKIRNLEKRKSKLESYRELQRSGKDLNQDQKVAVAKYEEVVQTLEFARDLSKQFLGIAVVSEKDEKKKARKDAIHRSQVELAKVREVLLVQDALTNMGQEFIRDDFLQARNGAASLSVADLKLLDDLYPAVTPKHEAGDPTAFTNQVQGAAEHLLCVVDGKTKEAFGATYGQIKEVIGKIHESGYLDQEIETITVESSALEESSAASAEIVESIEAATSELAVISNQQIESIPMQQQVVSMETMTMEVVQAPLPPIPQVIVESMVQQQQQIPIQMEQVQMLQQQATIAEPQQQIYYQQQQPLPPQPRPISEVLGAGSFFFLQDSELDTPPEQIPTQTFTNQNYGVQPPPPIPLPQHFAPYPSNAPQQQQQPPVQMIVQQPHPQASQPIIVQQPSKNGIGEHHHQQQQHLHQEPVNNIEEVNRHRGNRPPQQRNSHHQQQQQPFFANNNGYNSSRPSNRGRNSTGGPSRPNNNRQQLPPQ